VRRQISIHLTLLLTVLAVGTLVAAINTSADAERRRDRGVRTEIVGGSDVPDGVFPFAAAIGTVGGSGGIGRVYCGGSLIAPSYVLTAAHCVHGEAPGEVAVVVGQTELGTNQGVQRGVTAIAIHPGHNSRTGLNDLAVLTLAQPVDGIAPVTLVGFNDGSFDSAGTWLKIVGWGDTRLGKSTAFSPRLQQRDLAVVDDSTCAREWRKQTGRKYIVASETLCTTGKSHGTGDSGGPIFTSAAGANIQVSLTSTAFGGDSKRKIANYGPQLSSPGIRSFITSIAGV